MAYGSVVQRTRTTTKTRTSTATSTSTSTATTSRRKLLPSSSSSSSSSASSDDNISRPRFSSSRRRLDADSDSSSAESDFDKQVKAEARRDARESRDKADRTRIISERRAYKKRGEAIPPELKLPPKGKKGGGKDLKGATGRKSKDDEQAVLDLFRHSDKGKGKARANYSSGDERAPTTTTRAFDRKAKRREVEARTGLRLINGHSDTDEDDGGADEVMHALRNDNGLSDNEEEVKKHLARRWVNKKNPSAMSARRKALELKYNPLVKLLNVQITVISTPDKPVDSDEERRAAANAHIVNLTDDESGPDTDWDTDGMGELNGSIRPRPRPAAAQRKVKTDESSSPVKREGDDEKKPRVLKLEMDEDVKPSALRPQPPRFGTGARLSSPADVKPSIIELSDDEPEPSTQEEDSDAPPAPALAAALVAKPRLSLSPDIKPFASTSTARNAPLPAPAPMELDRYDEDSGAEPDTEPSDAEADEKPIAAPGASEAPHFPAHSHGGSQTVSQRVKPEPVERRVKLEEVDGEGDEGEHEDAYVRGIKEAQAKRLREERRAKAQEAVVRSQRLRVEEERKKRNDGVADDRATDEDEQDEQDEEAELPMWETNKRQRVEARENWPQPVRKGRPKFQLLNAQQANTGPHSFVTFDGSRAQIPAPVNRFLRPYQREGAEFLFAQYRKGMGGVLGDDMGLGKTIQVIAFLSAVMGKQGLKKYDEGKRKDAINDRDEDDPLDRPSDIGPTCLITCPVAVVHNWEREFQTWGYFDVGIYAGNKQEKASVLRRFDLGYLDVLIAGIETVRDNVDELIKHDFTILVVDEAHRVKNPKSGTTIALNRFPTQLRYGLTGTAIQNRLSEFWCILNWAVPGWVGTRRQWEDLVSRPLKFAQQADATDEELALGRTRAMALVSSLLPNFWLRRTKDSVRLQLPKKTDNVVICPLTELQRDVYTRLLELEDVQIMLTADDPCPCGEVDDQGLPFRRGSCCEQKWTQLIFKYITLFQKVSNHLSLIYPDKEDKTHNPTKYAQDLEWVRAAFPDDWQERKPGLALYLDPELCGKWKILCELLEVWHAHGDKVLIFSMSLKIIGLLKSMMDTTRYRFLTLDGSTPQDDRMPLVDAFNDPESDVFCFLISTRAGGVGLNLTAANRVVIFDPNWNPAHDLQAMDRAYRFGQRREVNVYRLIGAGTLEELIYNRQQYKRAIANTSYDAHAERRMYTGVEGEGKAVQGELWGVKNIFQFRDSNSLTEHAIRRTNLEELEYALRHSSIFETDDGGKIQEFDEPNEEEVVAEVTGYSKKAEPTNAMSPEELAKHEKHLAEQAEIANILAGARTTVSDATLGESSIEKAHAHAAIHGQQHQSKAIPGPSKVSTAVRDGKGKGKGKAAAAAKRKSAAALLTDEDDAPWDPLSRGRLSAAGGKKASSPSAPKKVKVEPGAHTGGLFASAGLDDNAEPEKVLLASGYDGTDGVQRFMRELEACRDNRRKKAMLEGVVERYKQSRMKEEMEE
ncbi:uncharacterized protein JCM10292_005359 [Rhodotorula paludigena]|uniref:uncharacterized protein n=1 Tax=Rhodotorula paludigena TaxID=86838 RepID=UPI003180669C